MILETILGVGAIGIGSLYIWLKRARKKEFEAYLKSEEKHLQHMKTEGWLVNGVYIPYEIDYNATRKKFKKTKFWNWEFRDMVVTRKKK